MSRIHRLQASEILQPAACVAGESTGTTPLDLPSLWDAYRTSRANELRNKLLMHYLPLAQMIARQLASRIPGGGGGAADVDDLIQAATLGLRDAIATFDPGRGLKFEQYCGARVRGAALDFLRSLDWAPRLLRSRVARVQEMSTQLEMQSGHAPTDEQVAGALNMPLEELRETRKEVAAPVRIRLCDSDEEGGEGNGIDLNNLADEHPVDPAREAQCADLREFLEKGLGRVERQVMLLYYFDNLSFREIGGTLELCESRVSQIHQAVLSRLRERMHRIGGASLTD